MRIGKRHGRWLQQPRARAQLIPPRPARVRRELPPRLLPQARKLRRRSAHHHGSLGSQTISPVHLPAIRKTRSNIT